MALLIPFEKYSWPMKHDHMKPFQHQMETTKFFLMNPRSYCFSDLGVGKTLSALWAAHFLLVNKKIRKILVVGPLSTLQSVWGSEIFSTFKDCKYAIAHGSHEHRIKMITSDVQFVIINHDGVVSMEDYIIRERFDVIIVDELTAFKKHTNNRSKAMCRIAKKSKAVWGLTGAPTPNSPVEAFGQAKVVNPFNEFLPTLFSKFKDSVVYPLTPYIDIPTDESKQIVNRILQPAIRFERDKCIDIPETQYIEKIVPLSNEQKSAYESMRDQLKIEYARGEITALNAAVKIMKLMQVAAGQIKNENGDLLILDTSPRDQELWDIFEETGKTKLVIFTAFKASVEHLHRFFLSKNVKCKFIHGEVPQQKRAEIIRDFQDGDLQVIILQPQSTSHGITLTASNVIVWYTVVPSGETHLQANGRITRAGQTRKQLIIYLLGTKAERHLINLITHKKEYSNDVLDLFAEL